MNKKLISLATLFFLLAAGARAATLMTFLTACDSPTGIVWIHGQVTNGSTGVSGATVKMTKADDSTVCQTLTTSSFGYYSFNLVFTQGYFMHAEKHGYTSFDNYLNAIDSEYVYNMALTE